MDLFFISGIHTFTPFLYAGIQIELKKKSDQLTFINKYRLGTQPKEFGVFIIKKENFL